MRFLFFLFICWQKELVKRLYLLLTVKDSAANIPKNLEARRRLEFFSNSLFMEMPSAKPVSEMVPFRFISLPCSISSLSFFFPLYVELLTFSFSFFLLFENSVFTPYYSETVLYSSSDLQKENEDGISILFYLQKIFPGIFLLFLSSLLYSSLLFDLELMYCESYSWTMI